jgi:putative SOS response-associated peptidase YedK
MPRVGAASRDFGETPRAGIGGRLSGVCARYDVIHTPEQLARELGATLAGEIPARPTIAPTDMAPVLVKQPSLVLGPMRFGWPGQRPKERIQVNVRSETATRAPRSRDAVRTHRCLVPITAFHEWSGEKRARVHHVLTEARGQLLTLAGLYEIEHGEEGKRSSFVILTTAANDVVRPIHDRMPLVVPPSLRDEWLDRGADPAKLIERVREAEGPPIIERPVAPPTRSPKR